MHVDVDVEDTEVQQQAWGVVIMEGGVRTTDPSITIVSPDFGNIWETYYIK